jgi:uncharacterized membrane protein
MPNVKKILLASLALFVLDAIYLFVNKHTFTKTIQRVQKSDIQINFWAVVLCYGFILFGLYHFIWRSEKSVVEAGILGAVIYGVYDTTTVAILKDWNIIMAGIDIVWGAFLFASATYIYKTS